MVAAGSEAVKEEGITAGAATEVEAEMEEVLAAGVDTGRSFWDPLRPGASQRRPNLNFELRSSMGQSQV